MVGWLDGSKKVWRKRRDEKMPHHCGLCKKEVDDWEEHVKTKEHQSNLQNPRKILAALVESQSGTFKAIKEIKEEDAGNV